MKLKCETLENLNIKLQEKISEVLKHQFVKCENLIDL